MKRSQAPIEEIKKINTINKKSGKTGLWKVLLIIPVVIYLPGMLGWIPFPSETAQYTDLLLAHYPNAIYLRNAILQDHSIPLWSNLIYSGVPFAANPLSGVWYLPGWIALIFPLPAGISIVLGMHSVFGTWGFYKLLKSEGAGDTGSIIGGIAFGLMPKFAAHYGAGHVSLLYALAWTPWLLLESRNGAKWWRTGVVLAFLFLADPRWAAFTGLIWISYYVAHRRYDIKEALFFYVKSSGIAFLIASPLILPMMEFTRISTRSMMTTDDVLLYSLPPEKLLGLIIPSSVGNTEWFMYQGGLIILLFILQLFIKEARKLNVFWSAWIVLSLLISFGALIPGAEWAAKLPLVSLLRVPSRALFIMGIGFAAIAGKSSDLLINQKVSKAIVRKIAFGVFIFTLLLGSAIAVTVKTVDMTLLWGFVFLNIAALGLLVASQTTRTQTIKLILIGIAAVDLIGAGYLSYNVRIKEQVGANRHELINYIQNDDELFRTFSPSYSIPQYMAVEQSLEMADGVDPLQIDAYAKYMSSATGIHQTGYSVSIPPYETGNSEIDNLDSGPDALLMGLINVKYLVSEFEIFTDGFVLLDKIEDSYIYLNEKFLPRAWVQNEDLSSVDQQPGQLIVKVNSIDWRTNQINLTAQGPGKLVLSEIYYPGWIASVDGVQQDIKPVYDILRSINLEDGVHEVSFKYRPISIIAGIILAFVGWTFVIWKYLKENR
jgi:hypothetical protein